MTSHRSEPTPPRAALYPRSPLGERVPGIPTGRDVEWEPLVDYRRNGVSETTIHGAVAWASGGKVVHSFGGNVLCYGRSMMKPFMMKVFANSANMKNKDLLERRQRVVPNGVGAFSAATVERAFGATIIDVDGNELIDFAGGIGVVNAGHCPPPLSTRMG